MDSGTVQLPSYAEASTSKSLQTQYKLIFFLSRPGPPQHMERLKIALFATGAGTSPGIGTDGKPKYTESMFYTTGHAQFLPGPDAKPHSGKTGKLKETNELKCEMICVGEEVMRRAVEALRKHHPDDEPAYEVYRMETI